MESARKVYVMHGNDETMQPNDERFRREIDGAWEDVKRALEDSRDNRDGGANEVSHPSHYAGDGSVECIDAIRSALGRDGFTAFCRGNAMKYLWRAGHKGDAATDYLKAVWYINEITSESDAE
jgi:hypothetical protein